MLDLQPDTKYLITLDHWFYAPNGSQYNAVWGTVDIPIEVRTFDVPAFMVIGKNGREVHVLASRVTTSVRSEQKPNVEMSYNDKFENGHNITYTTPTRIYIAE